MAYPIKYAPMPVMVVKEWDSILGENKTELDIYYIASRCYVLGETKRILRLLIDNELVALEQRNRAEFCAKYCDQLQRRLNQSIIKKSS